MSSQVLYRFRNEKTFAKIKFQGMSISKIALISEIMRDRNLDDTQACDFSIINAETETGKAAHVHLSLINHL